MFSSKEKKFLKEQIEVVDSKLRSLDPTSTEYKNWLNVREELVKQLDHDKVKIPILEIITQVVIPIGSTAASIAVSLYLAKKYEEVAKMSYGLDEDFKLCNGRSWNIKDKIMSLLPKKF